MDKLLVAIKAFNKIDSVEKRRQCGLSQNAYNELLTCLVALKTNQKDRLAVVQDEKVAEWVKQFGFKVREDNGWYAISD